MARETKVGLLAGLAFIICFAIILANRGEREFADIASLPVEWQKNPAEKPAGASTPNATPFASASRNQPSRLPIRAPASGLGQDQPNQHDSPANSSLVLNGVRDTAHSGKAQPPAGNRPTSPLSSGPREQTLEELAQNFGRANPVSPVENGNQNLKTPNGTAQKPGEIPATQTQLRKYSVAAGDTLSKIAFAHYGSRSKSIVKSICDANPTSVPNPDELRVGVELILPEINRKDSTSGSSEVKLVSLPEKPNTKEHVDRNSAGESKTLSSPPPVPAEKPQVPASTGKSKATRSEKPEKSSEPTYRWYEVKKGDRYASIARQVLGDAGRWKEIHELNKDRIGDPQSIKEGVRIKLPEAVRSEPRSRRK